MCTTKCQKMVLGILKQMGDKLTPDITKEMIDSMVGITGEILVEMNPFDGSKNFSESAMLISYIAQQEEIGDIQPALSIYALRKLFENKGKLISSNMARPVIGDIIFFMANHPDSRKWVQKAGVIYRTETNARKNIVWFTSVGFNHEIQSCVIDTRSTLITGYGHPTYGVNEEYCANVVDILANEADLMSDNHVKYCGQIRKDIENGFCYVRMGAGNEYATIPGCSILYPGNYVEVYEEVSCRTPGKGDQTWLLIRIDNYCFGYVPKDSVILATYQTIYPSGPVCLGDTVHFLGGSCYGSAFDPNPYHDACSREAKVIEMNLHSANPYRLIDANISPDHPGNMTNEWWVTPDCIEELR